MTAHELARALLEMPDVPVHFCVGGTCEDWTEEVTEINFDSGAQQITVE